MLNGISIRVAIIGAVCAAIVLCTVAGGILVWQVNTRLSATAADTVMGYARMVDSLRRQWVVGNETLMQSIITRDVLQFGPEFSREQCEISLKRFSGGSEQISNVAVATPDGQVICATNSAFYRFSQMERPYFRDALDSTKVVEGGAVRSVANDSIVIPLVYAVRGEDGTPRFVVTIGRTSRWFQQINKTLDLPAGIHIEILDQSGATIAAYPDVLHEFPHSLRERFVYAMAEDQSEVVTADGGHNDGSQRVYAILPLPKGEWGGGILVSLPEKTVRETFQGFVASLTVIMITGMFLMAATVLWLLRHLIGEPITRLAEGVRTIAVGAREWDGQSVKGCAEIQELSQNLERMVRALEHQEEHIQGQADTLARSNEDLQGFAYTISHDLREPLRTVSSFAQLLERRCADELSPEAKEFLSFITEGVARMTRMLDGILEFSRVRTRGQAMKVVDLALPVENAVKSLALMAEEHGAVIGTHSLCPVFCDEEQIARVFQNLIGNAIKFAKPDVPAHIQVSATPLSNGMVEVEVSDNGIGMGEEGREKIFTLFHRLVPRDSIPGDGLGLALCKRIIERHGGRIWVESRPGSGSVFHFTLPGQETSDEIV